MTKSTSIQQRMLIQHNAISLEQVGLVHSGSEAIKRFSKLVSEATSYIGDTLSGFTVFFKDDPAKKLKSIEEFANKAQYMDVRRIIIQVPEGFKGNLTDYSEVILRLAEDFYKSFDDQFLVPFDLYISKMITNPLLLDSVTYTSKVKLTDIEKYKKPIAKFFTGDGHGTLPLGDVFGSMSNIKKYYDIAIKLATLSAKKKMQNTASKVKEINEKVNVLVEMLQDQKKNYNIKPTTLQNLSTYVYELARQVEFYAVVDSLLNSVMMGSLYNTTLFAAFLSGDRKMIEESLENIDYVIHNGEEALTLREVMQRVDASVDLDYLRDKSEEDVPESVVE